MFIAYKIILGGGGRAGAFFYNAMMAGNSRDSLIVQALTQEAHMGYQSWHRLIDNNMAGWLVGNQTATPIEFLNKLYSFYNSPEMIERFGQGVLNGIKGLMG